MCRISGEIRFSSCSMRKSANSATPPRPASVTRPDSPSLRDFINARNSVMYPFNSEFAVQLKQVGIKLLSKIIPLSLRLSFIRAIPIVLNLLRSSLSSMSLRLSCPTCSVARRCWLSLLSSISISVG